METIRLSDIDTSFQIRSTQEQNINKLAETMKNGYIKHYPILIDNNNVLIDGHHRVAVCKNLGIEEIPCIKYDIPTNERVKIAVQANEASENSIPMTMVDYCELIWSSKDKLADIALQLGWSEDKTKRYSALSKVTSSAWEIVVTNLSSGTTEVTFGTFTEGILRQILKLTDSQQLELVTDLANGTINKNKFKVLAEKYREQNEDIEKATKELEGKVSKELLSEALSEIEKGNYNLEKLIQLTIDKHDKKTSIKLIHGDFYEEVKNVPEESIDLIITDPPYNIAHDNERVYEDRKNVSMDFGEWDKVVHSSFKQMIMQWAKEFKRILSKNGSGYIFTSDVYLSHIREYIEEAGLRYRATIVWHKTNPGTSPSKGNYISSNEFIIFFDNGEKPTLNWMGDANMLNFYQSPICGGNERIKDKKGNTLHPTQKPIAIIQHLMEISSNVGDKVFDGFMGSGTTAEVAKLKNRKFIGIEMDETYFNAAKARAL